MGLITDLIEIIVRTRAREHNLFDFSRVSDFFSNIGHRSHESRVTRDSNYYEYTDMPKLEFEEKNLDKPEETVRKTIKSIISKKNFNEKSLEIMIGMEKNPKDKESLNRMALIIDSQKKLNELNNLLEELESQHDLVYSKEGIRKQLIKEVKARRKEVIKYSMKNLTHKRRFFKDKVVEDLQKQFDKENTSYFNRTGRKILEMNEKNTKFADLDKGVKKINALYAFNEKVKNLERAEFLFYTYINRKIIEENRKRDIPIAFFGTPMIDSEEARKYEKLNDKKLEKELKDMLKKVGIKKNTIITTDNFADLLSRKKDALINAINSSENGIKFSRENSLGELSQSLTSKMCSELFTYNKITENKKTGLTVEKNIKNLEKFNSKLQKSLGKAKTNNITNNNQALNTTVQKERTASR